jgi:hypothetical protein
MGLFDWLFGRTPRQPAAPPRFDINELARRLKTTPQQLQATKVSYCQFQVPKRSGGTRTISAPDPQLKTLQRLILRRVLGGLAAHPAACGFEAGQSIVTNALPHVGKSVIVKLDVKDFFGSTTAARVEAYLRLIGWDAESAALLVRLCTYNGSLPQGAPTSPRLSNLVNFRLDSRLAGAAESIGCAYTRYADDLTFSHNDDQWEGTQDGNRKIPRPAVSPGRINDIIWMAKKILSDEGYRIHTRKKLQIRRRHQRQQVTGLVVNAAPALPRPTRRWLRAVEHHVATNRPATLRPQQLQGWRALQNMIEQQTAT